MQLPGLTCLSRLWLASGTPITGCLGYFTNVRLYRLTIEEAYEVADAIEREDMRVFEKSRADLLLQVVLMPEWLRKPRLRLQRDCSGYIRENDPPSPSRVWGAKIPPPMRNRKRGKPKKLQNGCKEPLGVLARWMELPRGSLPCSVPTNRSKGPPEVGFDWPDIAGAINKLEEEPVN